MKKTIYLHESEKKKQKRYKMSKKIAIIGAGMMGSALAYPAFENGNEVRLVGTPLDRCM